MRARRTTITKLTAGLALTVLTMQGAAFAHEHDERRDPDPKDEVPVTDSKTALREDAALIAESQRWGLEETVEHLLRQDRFGALIAGLSDRYPDTYAGAVFADRPGAASTVRFVGEVPPDVVDETRRSGLKVELVGGAKASLRDLQKRAGEVQRHLHEQDGFAEVVTALTPDGGIEAVVAGGRGQPDLPPALAEGVRLEVAERPGLTRLEHTRGGARVTGAGGCTSGFTVESFAGVRGVTTAGHCTGINTYIQPEDGLTYGLNHQSQHIGFWGDVEWKTSSHWEPAEYYAHDQKKRPVESVEAWGAIAVNNLYCVYGRSSNDRECDQVYSANVSATSASGILSNLVAMDEDNTIPGDSGGPWAVWTKAAGGHIGDLDLGGATRNIWSVAALWPMAIGVNVRTQ